MQKYFFLATILPPLVLAWAPPTHPAPSKLLKALEFAEKAWRFPNGDEIHPDFVALNTSQDLEDRRHPWTAVEMADQSLSCMEDGEQYYFVTGEEEDNEHTYFDRIGGDTLCWMGVSETLVASTKKLTDHLTSHPGHEEFDEDCKEHYYDGADILCWAI